MKTRTSRTVALLTGGVLASSMFIQAAPARADKSKNLKVGAIVLGVGAAILLAKKKEVPAAIAGAGAYYAYKKSKDANNDDRFGYGYNDNNDGNYYPGEDSNYGNTNNYPSDTPYYGNSGDDVYPGYALRAQRRSTKVNSVRSFRRSGR